MSVVTRTIDTLITRLGARLLVAGLATLPVAALAQEHDDAFDAGAHAYESAELRDEETFGLGDTYDALDAFGYDASDDEALDPDADLEASVADGDPADVGDLTDESDELRRRREPAASERAEEERRTTRDSRRGLLPSERRRWWP